MLAPFILAPLGQSSYTFVQQARGIRSAMGNLQHAFTQIEQGGADPDADFSLPGWIYHDPEFFAL